MSAATAVPTRSVLPGLAVTAAAVAAAYGLSRVVPGANPLTASVVLGALVANSGLHRPALRPGTHLAAHRVLRIGVVFLGLQLSLPQVLRLGAPALLVVVVTVAITFLGTQALGRWLGVPPARALLVATGFSICGASAVAAMAPVSDADEDDVAVAVGLVTLCGTLAILVLPALREPLGLSAQTFGQWAGASVHDVGQTVATASRVGPAALGPALVVKLTRVALLAPLVTVVSVRRRRHGALASGATRPPLLPMFVAGFLVAVAARSTGLLPVGLLDAAHTLQQMLLAAALFGLGTGIHWRVLRRTGGAAAGLGLASWVLVATVAYVGVRAIS